MDTRERELDTTTADGDMAVVITEPVDEGTSWPTVLLFIDAPGLRQATRDFMARLAGEGYRVITPDLHHRHGRLLTPKSQEEVWGWIASMTDDRIQSDGADALAAAGVPEETPYVAVGFCLGTRAVYRAIERNPDRVLAGSCWHPSFMADDKPDSPHLTAHELTRPMYLGIGEADEIQSIAMHQPFLDAVAPLPHVEVKTFAGADHGFTWPGTPNYHEEAAETGWTKTLEMFATAFAA